MKITNKILLKFFLFAFLFLIKPDSVLAETIQTPINCNNKISITSIEGIDDSIVDQPKRVEMKIYTKENFRSFFLKIDSIQTTIKTVETDKVQGEPTGNVNMSGEYEYNLSFVINDPSVLSLYRNGSPLSYQVQFFADKQLGFDTSCEIGTYFINPAQVEPELPTVGCGTYYDKTIKSCQCEAIVGGLVVTPPLEGNSSNTCCGWIDGIKCLPEPKVEEEDLRCGVWSEVGGQTVCKTFLNTTIQSPQSCSEPTICCENTLLCPVEPFIPPGNQDGSEITTGCGVWKTIERGWKICEDSSGGIVSKPQSCPGSAQCCSSLNYCSLPIRTPINPEEEPPEPSIVDNLTSEKFNELNPLLMGNADGSPSKFAKTLKSPGGFISRILLFAFPLAGLILFAMLSWAGFEMLAGASSEKSLDAGKQRATAAIVGFLLLFVSYWIMQIVEVIFGITIL